MSPLVALPPKDLQISACASCPPRWSWRSTYHRSPLPDGKDVLAEQGRAGRPEIEVLRVVVGPGPARNRCRRKPWWIRRCPPNRAPAARRRHRLPVPRSRFPWWSARCRRSGRNRRWSPKPPNRCSFRSHRPAGKDRRPLNPGRAEPTISTTAVPAIAARKPDPFIAHHLPKTGPMTPLAPQYPARQRRAARAVQANRQRPLRAADRRGPNTDYGGECSPRRGLARHIPGRSPGFLADQPEISPDSSSSGWCRVAAAGSAGASTVRGAGLRLISSRNTSGRE